ncbi:MAG: hypothetical protein ACI3Y5_04975 [Prevotella sp.]
MKPSRPFITISLLLLLAPLRVTACGYNDTPTAHDNYILRITDPAATHATEPYYLAASERAFGEAYLRQENIRLWRRQTSTTLSDALIERYVYTYTERELRARRQACVASLGREAYDYLILAKQCEAGRVTLADPWYYPTPDCATSATLERVARTAMTMRGKYYNRYVLLAMRALVALNRYSQAVAFWEESAPRMDDDIIRTMAERHVAIAYRKTGDMETARRIYARIGDAVSLYKCLDSWSQQTCPTGSLTDGNLWSNREAGIRQVWKTVYEANPNSPFVADLTQELLSRYDWHIPCGCDVRHYCQLDSQDRREIDMVLGIARRAVIDKRVEDKAIWYYTAAALHSVRGDMQTAIRYARNGMSHCRRGTFIRNSMRVLRILLEAQTCRYDNAYTARLARDISWLSALARKSVTPELRQRLIPQTVFIPQYDGSVWGYIPVVHITNKMYWSDALNRILVDVLAPRLWREGRKADAILLANLGDFWLLRNATGRAHSPNSPEPVGFGFTDYANAMSDLVYSATPDVLMTVYQRVIHPQSPLDRLVSRHGLADKNYWADIVGTSCIAAHRYREAATWLGRVSDTFQKSRAVWPYFTRDPFCMHFRDITSRRHHIKPSPRYKLRYARRMARLRHLMRHATTARQRGEAMILYGVGMRNQTEWCWALTRYVDLADEREQYIDLTRSRAMIDEGLSMLKDKELKARYLHAMMRNNDVMDQCPNTKIAKKLRAHCDRWRDYKIIH